MPRRETHNRVCVSEGIEKDICDRVNRWMDEPSQLNPGCSHRESRHSREDCEQLAQDLYREYSTLGSQVAVQKAEQAYKACQLHREEDKKAESCGCKALFREW